jgi:Type II CAAX prenyl endopeptidase Rce1-like
MQAILSFFVLSLIAYFDGGFIELYESIGNFIKTGPIYSPDYTMLSTLKIVPAGMVIAIIFSYLGIFIAVKFGANFSSHSGFDNFKNKSILSFVSLIILFEEGVFRVFPIWISKLVGISPVIPLFIFSIFYGLMHWFNYKSKPSILVTLPQVFLGLLFSAVAVNYGIGAAMIFHLYFDFILFSSIREQKYSSIDVIIGIFHLFIAVAGYFMSKDIIFQLISILHWTAPVPTDFNPTLIQTLGILFLLDGAISAFTVLTGYDSTKIEKSVQDMSLIDIYKNVFISGVVFLSILQLIYNNVNFVHTNPVICFFVFVLMTFLPNNINSLSEMSQKSLKVLPNTLGYTVLMSASYFQMIAIFSIQLVFEVLHIHLQKYND